MQSNATLNADFALICQLADGQFHSGQDCARLLNISRSAVHQKLHKLAEHYQFSIDSVSGRGYRIMGGLDLLDRPAIVAALPETLTLAHFALLPSVDSTNQYLMDYFARNENFSQPPSPFAVALAESQTSGRGRRGRSWTSPFARNLYLSLLWSPLNDLRQLQGLSLMVGVTLVRVLQQFGVPDLGLKWPNDIMVADAKIAGILIEIVGDVAGPLGVVIGIGLNVNMQDCQDSLHLANPWTDLKSALPQLPKRNALAGALITALIQLCEQLKPGDLATYLATWQAYDVLLGKPVICQTHTGDFTGLAVGINLAGELRIQTEQGERAVNSGEVSVRLA